MRHLNKKLGLRYDALIDGEKGASHMSGIHCKTLTADAFNFLLLASYRVSPILLKYTCYKRRPCKKL
jgi:hypothetical protein